MSVLSEQYYRGRDGDFRSRKSQKGARVSEEKKLEEARVQMREPKFYCPNCKVKRSDIELIHAISGNLCQKCGGSVSQTPRAQCP